MPGIVAGAVFLESDDLYKEFDVLRSRGVTFVQPEPEPYPFGVRLTALDPTVTGSSSVSAAPTPKQRQLTTKTARSRPRRDQVRNVYSISNPGKLAEDESR